MKNKDIFELYEAHVAPTYKRFPVILHSGKGASARDFEGNFFVDFASGIGVNALGFCDDGWIDAVISQLHQLQHTSNVFYNAPGALLADKLCRLTGYSKVFFANSGAEANECAIKIARKYGNETRRTKENRIITLLNSFHGRTITTLAATGQDSFHEHFSPFTPGFCHVMANESDELHAMIDDTICGIMIELVQGEGGVVAIDREYVKEIERICRENDIIFIVDEVQTGIGRTGTLLCSEQYEINPDIITLAKGLGGGLPIGAILMNDKAGRVLQPGEHGSTFGGNPVICAGGIEILERVSNKHFLDDVRRKSIYIKSRLSAMPNVEDVSGIGLLIGISLANNIDARSVAECCARNGLLVLVAKSRLRLMPPLNITDKEIGLGLEILYNCLNSLH